MPTKLPPPPLAPELDDGGRYYLRATAERLLKADEKLRPVLERAEAEGRIVDAVAFTPAQRQAETERILRGGAPKILEADVERWTPLEAVERGPELDAALKAKTFVPRRGFGRRPNDRGWTIAQLEAEEAGPPAPPRPVHYERDLARLPLAEREKVFAAVDAGAAELVGADQGRRGYLERLAAAKAEHEKAVREWDELTGKAAPPPATSTPPPADLAQRTIAQLEADLADVED